MDALLGEDGLLTSLLNLGGITVPARTRFIASTVATTTYSSLTFGLFSGLVGAATPMGPLVPFLSGCWMGYSFGVYAVWRSAKMMAVRCAERYPKLLAHALEMEFGVCVPRECVNAPPLTSNFPISEKRIEKIDDNTMSTSTWKNPRDDYERSINYSISMHPLALWICNGGAGRLSWAILAAQECQRSIIELERDQRDQIVEANYKNMMDDNE